MVHAYEVPLAPDMIRDSYRVCGQSQKPDPVTGLTISLRKIMKQCYFALSESQIKTMEDATIPMVALLKANGRNTWDDMEHFNIAKSSTSINRDHLTHIRHWSEIVNHKQTVGDSI